MSHPIQLSYEGPIAHLTMAGDEQNSIDDAFLDGFREALRQVGESASRVLLIRSAREGFFSNGFHPDVFLGAPKERIRASFHSLLRLGAEQFLFPIPTISLITGHAAGGGAFIAVYSDFRLMSMKKARMGFTEANLAMTVPSVALEILSRKIGYQNVLQSVLQGSMFKAADCLRLGLVDEIFDNDVITIKKAESLARRIAALPAVSTRSLKKNARAWIPADHLERQMEADLDEIEELMLRPECQEAFAALKSGRRPKFD